MLDRRLLSAAVFALLFILTGVVAVAVLTHGSHEPLGTTVAIGTLGSLLASLIVSGARVVANVQPHRTPTDSHVPGLIGIRAKHSITADEWLDLLRKANTEFYVAGHSLGKWCSTSNRDDLKSHVRRVLEKGRVTLVMLDPSSSQIERLKRAVSVDYTARINISLMVLGELWAELPPSSRARLRVAVLTDHLTLPYMLVGNERRLVTATYLGSTDSDNVTCLELDRSCEAATAVYDDFCDLARAGVAAPLPATRLRPHQRVVLAGSGLDGRSQRRRARGTCTTPNCSTRSSLTARSRNAKP